MRETVTIPLSKPLRGPNGQEVKTIVLREPTFDEYLSYGDPVTIAQAEGGTPFVVDNEDVIRKYISLCLVEPKDPQLLSQGGARLGRQVKQKLMGFFQPDGPESEGSETSQTTSPSEASGGTASPISKG